MAPMLCVRLAPEILSWYVNFLYSNGEIPTEHSMVRKLEKSFILFLKIDLKSESFVQLAL